MNVYSPIFLRAGIPDWFWVGEAMPLERGLIVRLDRIPYAHRVQVRTGHATNNGRRYRVTATDGLDLGVAYDNEIGNVINVYTYGVIANLTLVLEQVTRRVATRYLNIEIS